MGIYPRIYSRLDELDELLGDLVFFIGLFYISKKQIACGYKIICRSLQSGHLFSPGPNTAF